MLEKATGKVVILASRVSADSPKDPGSVINYANDLDIAQDGTVYFTTSSDIPVVPNALGFWDTFAVFMLTMLQVGLPYIKACNLCPPFLWALTIMPVSWPAKLSATCIKNSNTTRHSSFST